MPLYQMIQKQKPEDVAAREERSVDVAATVSDSKGARSYKGQIIGDSMSVTINFKWLIQLVIFVAMVVYGWWQLESRIQELERNMVLALEEIELHEAERKHAEKTHVAQMEERMLWYESELNLNPFSWGKKNKK